MDRVKRILTIFIIFSILHNAENKKKHRTVYFLGFKHNVNPKYVKKFHIDISQNKTTMNILIETQVIVSDMWGTAGISVWQKQSRTYRSIISYDFDFCQMLLRLKLANMELLKAWISNLLKYSNITGNCPFKKNVYYISNMKIDQNTIPPFVPSGKFLSSLILYRKEENDLKEIMGTAEINIELK